MNFTGDVTGKGFSFPVLDIMQSRASRKSFGEGFKHDRVVCGPVWDKGDNSRGAPGIQEEFSQSGHFSRERFL